MYLTHVAKRLKKNLKKLKPNTKTKTYIQHKLTEWIADYIAANYSTVILLNRGTTHDQLSRALRISSIMLQEFILVVLLERTHGVDGINLQVPKHLLP